MIKKFKKQGGFTVLESIVAIMILSLSVSGAFSAVGQSLSQAIISKDEVKAFYLAQEAIEIIRNQRDSNQLLIISTGGGNWLDGIISNCPFSTAGNENTCKVDAVATNKISLCSTGDWDSCSDNLKQNSDFLYTYLSGNDTNFKRKIQIESVSPDEIAVTVLISWTKGSIITKEFKIKTHLFKWI